MVACSAQLCGVLRFLVSSSLCFWCAQVSALHIPIVATAHSSFLGHQNVESLVVHIFDRISELLDLLDPVNHSGGSGSGREGCR